MQLTNEELKIAKRKYINHKHNCRGRVDRVGNPIEFRLTYNEWINIWLQSGYWNKRGPYKEQYVMLRFNDLGHYEVGNVEIKTGKENNIERNSSTEWKLKQKNSMKNRSTEWKSKQKVANQQRCNKEISCNSIIYESLNKAALSISPESIKHKTAWLKYQMIKFPDRYFYTK